MFPSPSSLRWPVAGLAAVALSATVAAASTLIIRPDGSGDYPSIQAALNAAANGDLILLADGVFAGSSNRNLDPRGKAVTVASQSGDRTACVIDAQGSMGSLRQVFYLHSREDTTTVIRDLTLRHGSTRET